MRSGGDRKDRIGLKRKADLASAYRPVRHGQDPGRTCVDMHHGQAGAIQGVNAEMREIQLSGVHGSPHPRGVVDSRRVAAGRVAPRQCGSEYLGLAGGQDSAAHRKRAVYGVTQRVGDADRPAGGERSLRRDGVSSRRLRKPNGDQAEHRDRNGFLHWQSPLGEDPVHAAKPRGRNELAGGETIFWHLTEAPINQILRKVNKSRHILDDLFK